MAEPLVHVVRQRRAWSTEGIRARSACAPSGLARTARFDLAARRPSYFHPCHGRSPCSHPPASVRPRVRGPARSMHRNDMMSADTFLAHIVGHAGVSIEHAERVARVVLPGLGSYLSAATRQLVADELPGRFGVALHDVSGVAVPLEEQLLEPGITAGRAHELVASVCRVLAEQLSTDALAALRAAVPVSLAEWLATPGQTLATRPAESRRTATLATGRPGSRHPISESRPIGPQTRSEERRVGKEGRTRGS